jgi:hypothetical protein
LSADRFSPLDRLHGPVAHSLRRGRGALRLPRSALPADIDLASAKKEPRLERVTPRRGRDDALAARSIGEERIASTPRKMRSESIRSQGDQKKSVRIRTGWRDDVVICERYSVGVVCEVDAKPLHADTLVVIRALCALKVVRDHDPRIAEPQKQVTPLWV